MYRDFCPVYAFEPRIEHREDLLLPASLFGISVPGALSPDAVRVPTYVTPTAMVSMVREQPHSTDGGLSVVHGLTVADVTVRFSAPSRQWRRVAGAPRHIQWQFQGGDIYLNLNLSLYVLEGDRPQADDVDGQGIFALIMQHELLHVADEIDIVRNWLPTRLYADQFVRRHLSQAQPVDEGMYRLWFAGSQFENWIRDSLWASEHNRRQRLGDSATEYRALNEAIDRLRIRQANPGRGIRR